jgi:hypothetical protein
LSKDALKLSVEFRNISEQATSHGRNDAFPHGAVVSKVVPNQLKVQFEKVVVLSGFGVYHGSDQLV